MLKKFLSAILTIIFSFSFVACYNPKTIPIDQMPSEWVCYEPSIKIIVLDGYKENGSDPLDPICIFKIDGQEITGKVDMYIYEPYTAFSIDDELVLSGESIYEDDYFIFKVKEDKIFNNKYERLVFKRKTKSRQVDGSLVS